MTAAQKSSLRMPGNLAGKQHASLLCRRNLTWSSVDISAQENSGHRIAAVLERKEDVRLCLPIFRRMWNRTERSKTLNRRVRKEERKGRREELSGFLCELCESSANSALKAL